MSNVEENAATTAMMEDMERQYVAVQEEKNSLQKQLDATRAELVKVQNQNTELLSSKQQASLMESKWKEAETKLQDAISEKRNQQERTDRMQQEADSLREEISRLTTSNTAFSKQIAEYQVQVKISESEVVPLHHAKKRLETELDAVTAHCSWLEQELHVKQQDYHHLQVQSRDRSIQMQMQLDQTLDELEGSRAQLQVRQKLEKDLQNKLKTVTNEQLNLKHELQTLKESSEAEIQEERKIIELQKRHIANWQKRYEDVVRENENLQKTARDALAAGDDELNKAKAELEQKYLALLDEQASKYEAKLKEKQPPVFALPAAAAAAATATTAYINQDSGEPLGMTELYSQLEQARLDLSKKEIESKSLKRQFEKVQREIQRKMPEMLRQREEYELAISQLEDRQNRLEAVIQERDDAMADTRDAVKEAAEYQKRLAGAKAESQQLAKQVQALLTSRSTGTSPDDIPTTTQEVQEQNQRLLSENLSLQEDIKELKVQLQSDSLRAKLEAAEREMEELKNERKEQEILVERIVQQRDLYRALLNKHDSNLLGSESEETAALTMAQQQSERAKKYEHRNAELEGELKAVQATLNRAIRDKEDMAERVARFEAVQKDLHQNMGRLERELLTARGEAARIQSGAEYHKEKCMRLEDSLERSRQELVEVNASRMELQKINADLQSSVSAAKANSAKLEGEVRQAQARVRLVETQLENTQVSEKRQIEENQEIRAEMIRQGSLIDSIRRIEASLSAKSESEKENLQRELESVKNKLENTENKHKIQLENLDARILEQEAQIKDLQGSNQKHQADALAAKKELLEAKSDLHAVNAKNKVLETQLRAAKRKLGEDDGTEDAEVTMQARIESLESELEAARSEVASLTERAEKFQKIAKASEVEVSEIRQASDGFKVEQEKQIVELKKSLESSRLEIGKLQDIIRDLTSDLAGQRDDRDKLERELNAQIDALKTEIHNNEKDVELARASTSALKHDIETLRAEASTTQKNYERELTLHAQARTALRVAQEATDEESRLRLIAEEKVQGLTTEHEKERESWLSEKKSMQASASSLEKIVQETREQNKVLHQQLETLNSLAEKKESSRIAGAESGVGDEPSSGAETQKVLCELREIVKFLRSENELLQTQLDTEKRVAEREKAATSVIRRSLEEARSELKSLQSQKESKEDDSSTVQILSEKLQGVEEQLVLLKDSNKLLREDAEKLQAKLLSTQKELEDTQKASQPSEEIQRDLGSKIKSLEAERDSLKRELESWKRRMTSLVSNFNQIDPEEHRRLTQEVDAQKKEIETLKAWKKTTEDDSTRIRGIAKKLKQQNEEQKGLIESQKKEILKLNSDKEALQKTSSTSTAETTKEVDELKIKMSKMEKETTSVKTELEGANTRNDRLRQRLREFQTKIRDLEKKEISMSEELASVRLQLAGRPNTAPQVSKSPQTVAQTSKPEETSKTIAAKPAESKVSVTQPDNKSTPSLSIPKVPPGGFKYGPSGKSSSDSSAKQTSTASTSSLRASASAFTPSLPKTQSENNKNTTATDTSKSPVPQKQDAMQEKSKTVGGSDASKSPTPLTQEPAVTAKTAISPIHVASSVQSPATAPRRASGETKELSIKERLLEKKRRLAEALREKALREKALKRKQGEESTDKKKESSEQTTEEQPPKKARIETSPGSTKVPTTPNTVAAGEEVKASAVSEEKKSNLGTAAVEAEKQPASLTAAKPETKLVDGPSEESLLKPEAEKVLSEKQQAMATTEEQVAEEPQGDDEKVSSVDQITQDVNTKQTDDKNGSPLPEASMEVTQTNISKGDEAVEEADEDVMEAEQDEPDNGAEETKNDAEKAVNMPFGSPSSNILGAISGNNQSFVPTAFGQSSALTARPATLPTTFGTGQPVPPTTFGGSSFLNIKPPGSSTAAPSFSFGTSSSITLPTPTLQPVVQSPFGAFGPAGGSGFGSSPFGLGPSSGLHAKPLFGAPVSTIQEEKTDDMEDDEDGANDMDAQD